MIFGSEKRPGVFLGRFLLKSSVYFFILAAPTNIEE
jgi:hypothetical protein